MMKIRIGNNVSIRWQVTTNGEVTPLSGRNLALMLSIGSLQPFPLDFSVIDTNVIAATYHGIDQRYVGVYSLTLWEDYGTEEQSVVDHCDAFELVPCSCDEESADDLSDSSIEVTSNLVIGIAGLSAYEVAVKNGFEGDETEWLASLKEPAESAASEVKKEAAEAIAEVRKKSADAIDVTLEQSNAAIAAVQTEANAAIDACKVQTAECKTITDEAQAVVAKGNASVSEWQQLSTDVSKAEAQRVSAEKLRDTSEKDRQSAETSRVQGEQDRKTAEKERQENEAERVAAFAEMRSYVNALQATIAELQAQVNELKQMNFIIAK